MVRGGFGAPKHPKMCFVALKPNLFSEKWQKILNVSSGGEGPPVQENFLKKAFFCPLPYWVKLKTCDNWRKSNVLFSRHRHQERSEGSGGQRIPKTWCTQVQTAPPTRSTTILPTSLPVESWRWHSLLDHQLKIWQATTKKHHFLKEAIEKNG